jgi:hypothetical protein
VGERLSAAWALKYAVAAIKCSMISLYAGKVIVQKNGVNYDNFSWIGQKWRQPPALFGVGWLGTPERNILHGVKS